MNKHTATVLRFSSSYPVKAVERAKENSEPLNDRHFLVLMNESDVSKTGEFLRFLDSYRPKLILDLRISPRLDFVAGSRVRTFRAFGEFSVQYIDVLGRLGVYSREDFLSLKNNSSGMLDSLVHSDENDDRPMVCLFDDTEVFKRCRKIFKDDIQTYVQERSSPSVSWFRSGLLTF